MCKYVFLFFLILNIYGYCPCCNKGKKYEDVSENVFQPFANKEIQLDIFKKFFWEKNGDNKNLTKEIIQNVVQNLKYINYRKLTLDQISPYTGVGKWDQDKVDKLKKQIDFINVVIYPYYIDFLLRIFEDKNSNKNNTSFVVSFGGSGRAIHWPSAYNIRKVASKNSPIVVNDQLKDDKRFSFLPIFISNKIKQDKQQNKLPLFYPGVMIDKNKEQLQYCRLVLNYLMQLANPIFYIYNNAIQDTASMYNVALMFKDIFEIDVDDFFYDKKYKELDIFSAEEFKSDEIIKEQLLKVGACAEEDVIMLAGVIVLNNLLYKVFKVANDNNITVNCTLGFESYSGRVWEMLIALWKKEYKSLPARDDCAKLTQNALQCVLTHCLIGTNNLCYNEATIGNREQVLIKVSQILKDLVLGEDRMDYLDCKTIFGYNIEELVLYWKNLTSKPTIQVISQIVDNEGSGFSGFFKHFFYWRFDRMLGSYYNSKYNDEMLSDEGLFIYHKNFTEYSYLKFNKHNSGGKYIKDDVLNIVYIIADAGGHLENSRFYPYASQPSRVYNIIDDI